MTRACKSSIIAGNETVFLVQKLCAKGRMLWIARNCGDDLHLFVAIVNRSVIETRRQVKMRTSCKTASLGTSRF